MATATWADGPLHTILMNALPTFVKHPFSGEPRLDVRGLSKEIENSYETVYKWLRTNHITPRNVQKLVDLANTPDNVVALLKLGRQPPKVEDFNRFVYA